MKIKNETQRKTPKNKSNNIYAVTSNPFMSTRFISYFQLFTDAGTLNSTGNNLNPLNLCEILKLIAEVNKTHLSEWKHMKHSNQPMIYTQTDPTSHAMLLNQAAHVYLKNRECWAACFILSGLLEGDLRVTEKCWSNGDGRGSCL